MPKVGKEWFCDTCNEPADYKEGMKFYCGKHWWEFLKIPTQMTSKQIKEKQNQVRAWNRGYI